MSVPTLSESLPVREVGVVALTALAVFVLLAMMSYSPFDNAWSYRSGSEVVTNLVGASGAYAADVLLYTLGRVAYLVPALLMWFSVRLLRGTATDWHWLRLLVRLSGALLLLGSVATLLTLHWPPGELPAGVGGVIGAALVAIGLPLFNWVGLTLIAVTGMLVALQAVLGFSWLDVMEEIGRLVLRACAFLVVSIGMGIERVQLWRDARRDRLSQRDAAAVPIERASSGATRSPFSALAALPARIGGWLRGLWPFGRAQGDEAFDPLFMGLETEERVLPEFELEAQAPPVLTETLPRVVERPKPAAVKKVPKKVPDPRQKALFTAPKGELPSLDLLDVAVHDANRGRNDEALQNMARLLEMRLKEFNIVGEVVGVLPGPVVTRFELEPAPGVKVQKITSLVKDLARSLAVTSVRVVEVIPGKSVVGIEIPNEDREMVRLKELLTADNFQQAESKLTLALGKDIAGNPVVADISKMPHLLVAGTTGSGKSVGVNAMLLSILYKAQPEEVRLILVDPKMLELSIYEGIPHLLTPVVTDMKEAAQALNWCVAEMERRYKLMAALGVRNLAGFNERVKNEDIEDPLWNPEREEPAPMLETLPYIVVVIDEFADMMMIVGKKVEQLIARIAQKARAAGIHLVLATQRPSVDVITGLIKANIPSRISFQVSSKVDSRTVLDQGGAEQLLGHGDMLYLPPGTAMPNRVHGAFVSDDEVHRLVADWKQRGEPDYLDEVLTGGEEEPFLAIESNGGSGGDAEQDDPLYDEAVAFVLESRRASTSAVQRKLRVGYNRAARLIDAMELAGVVSAMNSNGSREILVPNRDT